MMRYMNLNLKRRLAPGAHWQSSRVLPATTVTRRRAHVVAFLSLILATVGFTIHRSGSLASTLAAVPVRVVFSNDSKLGSGAKEAQGGGHLPDHIWHENGLLTVNSEGEHPIYELIRRAEIQWEEKQARASRSLAEAVRVYERRYGRAPPLGFDHWWDYVQENNVQLPDEYDQIYHDLEPYWGIDPADLRSAQFAWEGHGDSWTIGKDTPESPVTVVNMTLPQDQADYFLREGAHRHIDLLRDLWQYVPPFRATFSPHDGPNEWVDWGWKEAALGAAKRGAYIRPMCPLGSPLSYDPPPIGSWPTPQVKKTFIHDHLASMDVCQHPQNVLLHSNFLGSSSDVRPERFPAPQFTSCATRLHADIRAISIQATDEFVVGDVQWEEKVDDRLVWRGGPTGMWHREEPNITWRNSQRLRFVSLTAGAGMGGSFGNTSEFVRYLHPRGPNEPVGEPEVTRRSTINGAMMDVGFAGANYNCGGAVCTAMAHEFAWKAYMSQADLGRHKYLFDVDGNGWSARFRRLMSTHAAVFKATLYPEWYVDRIEPWLHYVPVQMDYSELYDALVFFAGEYVGSEGAHEEMAKQIGAAGREWVARYWRTEDMTAYMFRLFLEYARVMSLDRDKMDFELSQEPSN